MAAAQAGHSMEEHVRQLIEREVDSTLPATGFGTWLHEQFRGVDASGLDIPARTSLAAPPALPR